MKAFSLPLVVCIFLVACKTNSNETDESKSEAAMAESDSISVTESDEPIAKNKSPEPHIPEGSLLIHGNDIWVRDYPNTGEVIMKLNEGSICKILQMGRFDFIQDNGNNWYEIEFEGKTGWVFGSQTDKSSDDPEFWDPKPQEHSIQKEFKLKIEGTSYADLVQVAFDHVLTQLNSNGSNEDEAETNDIETERVGPNALIFKQGTPLGYVKNMISRGATNSVLQTINCVKEIGQASTVKWNYAVICSNNKGKSSVLAEINGSVEEIIPLKNGKYLIIAQFEIADLSLPQNRGHVWVGVYDPVSNAIQNMRKYGFYFSPLVSHSRTDHNEPFLVSCTIESANQLIDMNLNEEYRVFNDDMEVTRQYHVNRFFRFSEAKGFFEEIKQEEILLSN